MPHQIINMSSIYLIEKKNYFKTFTSPNPDVSAFVFNSQRQKIGDITYAVSPLFDKLYLFEIEVDVNHRRQGYGAAILEHLANEYDLPICPVQEIYNTFWHVVRSPKYEKLKLTQQLSTGDMKREASRWSYLRLQAEKLDQEIQKRFSNGESWEDAVGRGPD